MSMQNRSYSTVALWLLPMLILSGVGPSGNNNANKSPDVEVPWSWEQYERKDQNDGWDQLPPESRFLHDIHDTKLLFKELDDLDRMENKPKNPSSSQTHSHFNSLPVGFKTHNSKQDKYKGFLGPLDLVLMDASGVEQFEKIKSYRPVNNWNEKPSEGVPRTTATPSSTKTTAVICPSTYCLPEPSPFPPATSNCPASAAPTTCKPPPPSSTSKPTTIGSKCRKKSKQLSPKTAKNLLEIILATKKHVLSVLKALNYLEMEVRSHSSDDCPPQGCKLKQSQPKKKPDEQMEKLLTPSSFTNSQSFFFGIRPASQMESDFDMVLAREEELKLKSRVWEEHQQQMREMPSTKSSKHHMAPQAAVRLEDIRESQLPQKPPEHRNPYKHLPSKDSSDFGPTWYTSDLNGGHFSI
ncbi:uncharacterized protein [Drosophila kikkawai]|uniref:Uncharacterized protein n=1 Tax=Drosophila kikkawai TaxID=30033 RepID=A0A6P4IQD9_DROKI|nr:uncharacterized protein LOC108076630 [Drosophila kikkawai]